MSGGGGYKTTSSVKGEQKPVVAGMFDIFKYYLGKELPKYPGSAGVTPFTPQQVQKDYRSLIGEPVEQMWQNEMLGLVGPSARNYANTQFGLLQNTMSAQAGRIGEQSAYQEWLRTQPETGQAMSIAQAFIGEPEYFQYQQPRSDLPYANALLAGTNAYAQYAMLKDLYPRISQSGAVPHSPAASSQATSQFNQVWPNLQTSASPSPWSASYDWLASLFSR